MLIWASATFFSCSGKESVEYAGSGVSNIGFSTLMTRAGLVATPSALADAGGFDVWVYSHEGMWSSGSEKSALLEEETVTGSNGGTVWTYASPVMWPRSERVSFFAYGPAGSADVTEVPGGVPTLTYSIDSDPMDQTDLLIADHIHDQFGAFYARDKPVTIKFAHALSQVKFSASYAAFTTSTVKITSVVFKNVYCKGSTSLVSPVTWVVDTGYTDEYILEVGAGLKDVNITAARQNISAPDGMLYVMPQTLPGTAEIVATFTVGDVELSYAGNVPSPTTFVPGQSYNFHLRIEGDMLLIFCGSLDPTTGGSDWGNY